MFKANPRSGSAPLEARIGLEVRGLPATLRRIQPVPQVWHCPRTRGSHPEFHVGASRSPKPTVYGTEYMMYDLPFPEPGLKLVRHKSGAQRLRRYG